MKRIFVSLVLNLQIASVLYAEDVIKVACIGDSITYGIGTEDRNADSYPAQLQLLLGDNYLVANYGMPGATLLRRGHRPYMEQPEFARALDFIPDISIIHLGVNDTDPRDWPCYRDDFVQDYLCLVDSLRSVNQDMRILIAEITPITSSHPRFNSGTGLWQKEIRAAIRIVSKISGTQLIDFFTPLFSHPDYIPDSVHPDNRGARIMSEIAYSSITGDYGGLSMPPIYSDNMVFQRNIPVEIAGTANAETVVTVQLAGQKRKTVSGKDGKWNVELAPMSAASGLTLSIITEGKTLEYNNVAVGEVWLCSGQSNMEFSVKEMTGGNAALSSCDDMDLRLFNIKGKWDTEDTRWSNDAIAAVQNLDYYESCVWQPCNRESAAVFSAVGYSFGKMLRDSLDVPVGLICNAVGGSTTESWIDRNTLQTDFPIILDNWLENDLVQEWVRKRAEKNIDSKNMKVHRHPYEPCYLFETGIIPLAQYPIKGVIWYQGESNAHNFEVHETLFSLLVKGWRSYWNNPELPFYYVQLSSLDRPSWAWFRDSQRRLLDRIQYSGMAVSSDVGDSLDVHPKNKKPVGERLAYLALYNEYGHKDVVPSGPLLKNAEVRGNKVILYFDWSEGLMSSDGTSLRTFEVAQFDGLFYPAKAVIADDGIILHCDDVPAPRYVRYGWQPFTRANLINGAGLPASTFKENIRDRIDIYD